MRYIVLLRGINVGGHKKIKMTDLKNLLESFNFKNVKTYLQSGNVVLDDDTMEPAKLVDCIEKIIAENFGFSVKIIIRTVEELKQIIRNNPFTRESGIEADMLYVMLLSERPEASSILFIDVKKEENERFLIVSKEIYLYLPNGAGNTKLNNAIFEKILKTAATSRNWRTINNLLGISENELDKRKPTVNK